VAGQAGKRGFCCPALWAREDGNLSSGRTDREPATAIREPVAVIASPVAANVSPGTAPVAAIVSPNSSPFASRRADDCEPLHLPALRFHPAALNLGDCFSYALSQAAGEPLLFRGNDFIQTDVARC
jgi:hypothetical protein